MKRSTLCSSVLIGLLLLPVAALAKPEVTISVKAEKEVTTVKEGKKTIKLVPVKKIAPNETIIYTLHYQNKGDEKATNAVIEDAIPKGTAYVPESASTNGGEPQFSIDHGKTFNKPLLLTYEMKLPNGKVERRTAATEEYTNIRWTIAEIPAGATGKVSFKVKVK